MSVTEMEQKKKDSAWRILVGWILRQYYITDQKSGIQSENSVFKNFGQVSCRLKKWVGEPDY